MGRAQYAQLRDLIPRTFEAFFDRFPKLLPIQEEALAPLAEGLDALLAAPTAGGKTEAAVAPMLNRILNESGRFVEGPALLYIVPTRALVNDVYRRLTVPLQRMGLTLGRKTADHSSLRKILPQVLVTTPESFDSMLCRFPRRLLPVCAVVFDELHALDGTPRGDQLCALLTRLRKVRASRGQDLQLAMLSATIDHPEEMASRYTDMACIVRDPRRRPMTTVIKDTPFGESPADELVLLVKGKGGKVLVFANARADVESLAESMRGVQPFGERVYAHHGSLSKDVRERVEREFANANTALCFATSTLELGIDIGDVDHAVLYGVPPDLPSFLQRVGRAGRRSGKLEILALARDRGERPRFEHMVEACSRGQLLTDSPVYDPGTALQQAASLLFQNPGRMIAASHVLERLPQWQRSWWREGELDEALEEASTMFHKVAAGRYLPTEKLERAYKYGSIHSNIGGEAEVEVVEAITGRSLGSVANESRDDSPILLGGASRKLSERSDGKLVASAHVKGEGEARFHARPAPPVPGCLAQDLIRWLGLDPDAIHRVEMEERTLFLHGLGTLRGALLHESAGELAAPKPGRGVAFGLHLKRGFQDWHAEFAEAERLEVIARGMYRRLTRLLNFGPYFARLPVELRVRAILDALQPRQLARRLAKAEIVEVHADDMRQRIRDLLLP